MNQYQYMNRNCQMYAQRNCSPQPQYTSSSCAAAAGTSDNGSGCAGDSTFDNMSQAQLFKYLNEVSFAVDDILLYLDTHPCDQNALAYSRRMITRRKDAMNAYAKRFGPLTIDCTSEAESTSWEWISQPWPWEGTQKGGMR